MEDVYGYGEVGHEFRAGNEEEEEYDPGRWPSVRWVWQAHENGRLLWTYASKLFKIQHNPNVQPTVVSPLMLRQLKIRSNVNALPATRVVNNMRMVAQR